MIVAMLLGAGLAASPSSEQVVHVDRVALSHAHVAGLAAWRGEVVAVGEGGVEFLAAADGRRLRTAGVGDGLPAEPLRDVRVIAGRLTVQASRRACSLTGARWTCEDRTGATAPPLPVAQHILGHRETARLEVGGRTFVATAGAGVILDGRPLRDASEPCSGFVTALVVHRARLVAGTFDRGWCTTDDGERWEHHAEPRWVNALASDGDHLWIAAHEGVFRGQPGAMTPVDAVDEPGANGLAVTDARVFATTPGSLFELDAAGVLLRRRWSPGGSRSLQDVAVDAQGQPWLASEDRGLVQVLPRGARVFDKAAGLPSSWFLRVAIEPDGAVLGASLRDGVVRLDPTRGAVTREDGPDPWTLRVARSGDARLVGAQGGAELQLPARRLRITGLPDPNVHAFARFGEELWIGTERGLAVVSAGLAWGDDPGGPHG